MVRRTPVPRVGGERSSVTPVLLAVLVVGLALALGLAVSATSVVEAERARSVADATALAEVTGGSDAGDTVASANGASVTSRELSGRVRVVTVSRRAAVASAAATGRRQ